MINNLSIGELGEQIACNFLERRGYVVLHRNYRKKYGEIDIIARDVDTTLVFVEVKTIRGVGDEKITPEDNFSTAKIRTLKKICLSCANRNDALVDPETGWRMDLIAVRLDLTCVHIVSIKHYTNII